MSQSGKTVSCNILGTSKNIDRLKVLKAGAIRSCGKHKVVMNFMAEGSRPDFLPEEWNWINAEKYRLSDRHVHALIDGIANESFDYNIFCDDDVAIDIDRFVEMASSNSPDPCVWTTWPGERCNKERGEIIKKHASKYLNNKNLSDMFMGFCTSVINKPLCMQVRKNPDLLQRLLSISQDISQHSFIPDLQISILGFLAGAKHVNGQLNRGTCWPDFLNSTVFLKSGTQWHIHATGESPSVPCEKLIGTLLSGPFDSYKEMMPNLFAPMTSGLKAKEFVNQPFNLAWFWKPWRSRIDYPDVNDVISKNCMMHVGGNFASQGRMDLAGEWEACEGGWVIKNSKSTMEFFALYDGKYPVGVAKYGFSQDIHAFMAVPI